jgi:methylmalonyl-CoA/ethylmalonyl-CoA epimerase
MAQLEFDHVALATGDATDALELLVGRLGATELYGATDRGFRWALLHAGDGDGGMLIELLEPWAVDQNRFLATFLERRGEGAHHLTFKTTDILATIEAFERAGVELIDQRLENPVWREAFARPRDAHGTIVQVVETTIHRPRLADMLDAAHGPEPETLDAFAGGAGDQVAARWWISPARRAEPAALRCVVFGADDPDVAAGFYEQLLGGERVAPRDPGRIELAWPSGAHLAFERAGEGGAGIVAVEFEGPTGQPLHVGNTAMRLVPAGSAARSGGD